MKVSIDSYSGFCFGVKNTIEIAEKELAQKGTLFCVGEIVHNKEEIKRLEKKGLKTILPKDLRRLYKGDILIRAHGEPPSTYENAQKNNLTITEGTCPIVLKLQDRIKEAYNDMKVVNGQVVVYGNSNHPEVIGLLGHTENKAIVIKDIGELKEINFQKPIRLFAQTTKSKTAYQEIIDKISNKLSNQAISEDHFKFYKTICGHVSKRVPELQTFCHKHDVIIFVSGTNSSNGKFLFSICQKENPKSYFISTAAQLNNKWFKSVKSVGISGATSTPHWLMEEIAQKISIL